MSHTELLICYLAHGSRYLPAKQTQPFQRTQGTVPYEPWVAAPPAHSSRDMLWVTGSRSEREPSPRTRVPNKCPSSDCHHAVKLHSFPWSSALWLVPQYKARELKMLTKIIRTHVVKWTGTCTAYTDGETENTDCIRKQLNDLIHAACTVTGIAAIAISAICHCLNQQEHLQTLAQKSRPPQDCSVQKSSNFTLYQIPLPNRTYFAIFQKPRLVIFHFQNQTKQRHAGLMCPPYSQTPEFLERHKLSPPSQPQRCRLSHNPSSRCLCKLWAYPKRNKKIPVLPSTNTFPVTLN